MNKKLNKPSDVTPAEEKINIGIKETILVRLICKRKFFGKINLDIAKIVATVPKKITKEKNLTMYTLVNKSLFPKRL